MATYKLMQDIEAEDHILGPLTLRQFIFAMVTAFFGYIDFIVALKASFLLVLTVPPTLLVAFFAFPFGRDQPTEIWALGKIRFWFKPRQRVWNQSGVKEMVTITVPKKIEHNYTDGLSQGEVKSRLSALANTLDTRGWAVKNIDENVYANPLAATASDRLLDISAMPQAVPDDPMQAHGDMLDEQVNPIARQFDNMITQSSQQRRDDLIDQFNSTQPAQQTNQPWFAQPTVNASQAQNQAAPYDDRALSAQLHARASASTAAYDNMPTLQPLGSAPSTAASTPQTNPMPPQPAAAPDATILSLAQNNDLNISTLAREAQKAKDDDLGDGEVVISLR